MGRPCCFVLRRHDWICLGTSAERRLCIERSESDRHGRDPRGLCCLPGAFTAGEMARLARGPALRAQFSDRALQLHGCEPLYDAFPSILLMSTTANAAKIKVALIGCSHRTAPVELRERVAFTQQQALEAADELRHKGILEEAVVLSTCNRSELYGVPSSDGGVVTEAMEAFLTDYHRISRSELNGKLYRWIGPEAVRHLYRVTSGLDSMMLGEAEILGQVKTAYGQALDHGSTGPVLNRVFQGALEVGKRVRAETEVAARPMSVALAGVKLAERVFGNLKGHSALIVGAGAVAEQVVEHLRNRGIGSLRVANRSHDHASELAERMGGETVAWASLEDVLGAPDIIVTSVSSGAVLTREMLDAALAARNGRPVFVVDLGVPRNVDSDAADLYNLYLYNIDDLGE